MAINLARFESLGSSRMLRCSDVNYSRTLFLAFVSDSQKLSDRRIASLIENLILSPDQFYYESLVSSRPFFA